MVGSVSERLGDAAFAAALKALRGRQLTQARARGARLGGLVWRADRWWRPLAEAHVHTCLPDADALAVVAANYRHYGQILGELANLDRVVASADDLFTSEGDEHAEAVRSGGIIVTGHLGNWEVVGHGYTRRRGPVHALVKPIHNRCLDARINAMRRALDIHPIVTRGRALDVRRTLRDGGVLVVVADQNSLYHEGVFVPFFGRLASSHYGPAMLALDAKVPVITAFGERTPEGRFHIRYEPPLHVPDGSLRERTWALVAAWTARIEAAVRRNPEQWFWVHKRWKNQPRADVPDWKYGPAGRPADELPAPTER